MDETINEVVENVKLEYANKRLERDKVKIKFEIYKINRKCNICFYL
jgi:hypothetical protein